MNRVSWMVGGMFMLLALGMVAGGGQPRVTPGPSEPDWVAILAARYGLSMLVDLANPVRGEVDEVPGLFRKAGPGPVKYTPLLALGLETTTRGGWYLPGDEVSKPDRKSLWAYTAKLTARALEDGTAKEPPLAEESSVEFDPGDRAFGLWAGNDGLEDGGVFTEPRVVRAVNARLAKQPYKAMIYPMTDGKTGKRIANSYLIGWEYSTNDDFQDVVCRVDNVVLIEGGR